MQAVPSEFLAIDRKARAYIPYIDVELRDPTERICDFEDAVISLDIEAAMEAASRCVHCPDPAACVTACPAHNDIPSAMWLIEQGQFLEAAMLYRQTSSMPEICGRVCPHEQLCQGSCVRNHRHEPVLTGALEAFVTDYARSVEGVSILVGAPTGNKVAIVGAGPAGMACAEQLVQMGHQVTIFESKPAPGGLLVYGIPNFKLAKDVVFRAGMIWSGQASSFLAIRTLVKRKKSTICLPKGTVQYLSELVPRSMPLWRCQAKTCRGYIRRPSS